MACDRLVLEVPLFGEYIADAIVGDTANNALCLIEFEDGRSTSVFRPRRRRGTEWSERLEHGFSQIVDWFFWLFEDQQATLTFAAQFRETPAAG